MTSYWYNCNDFLTFFAIILFAVEVELINLLAISLTDTLLLLQKELTLESSESRLVLISSIIL